MFNQDGWVNVDIKGNVIGDPKGSGGPFVDIIGADIDIRPGQKAKKKASDIKDKALDIGKKALDKALKSNPVTAPLAGAADAAGLNPFGGDSLLKQLQDWIKDSGIFQRLALAILAFVFIGVALAMFGRQSVLPNVASIVKGK